MPNNKKSAQPSVPPVQSVQRALNILKCFSIENPELGITEIANRLALHKSTVHRIIATLETEGFLRQLNNGRYALSWRLFELGTAVFQWWGSRQMVLETLERIVERTGETAHLAVLDGNKVLYIEKVESPHHLRMPSAVGKRLSPHCTALGKVLLAGLDEAKMLSLIYGAPLERLTPNTITDPDLLRQELLKVRSLGYAIDNEEIEVGLTCIAAPVVNPEGTTCGAISISGPSSRVNSHLADHVASICEEVSSLSKRLGSQATLLREICSESTP